VIWLKPEAEEARRGDEAPPRVSLRGRFGLGVAVIWASPGRETMVRCGRGASLVGPQLTNRESQRFDWRLAERRWSQWL